MSAHLPLVETIPATCSIADVCRLLDISPGQFFALRKEGTFPIPEIEPRLDRRPRFSGEDVRRYLAGEFAPMRRRRSA